jgi:hypothetical protein
MTLKQIRDNKIREMVGRISAEMYAHYYGGNTIIFSNKDPRSPGGLALISAGDLDFIEEEKILDIIAEDGWECVLSTYTYPQDAVFTFTAKQEVKV